jgi:hypothetical protein
MNRISKARYTKEVREDAVILARAVGTSEVALDDAVSQLCDRQDSISLKKPMIFF